MAKGKNRKVEEFNLTETEIRNRNKEKINNVLFTEIKVIAKNESQRELIRSIKNNEVTICTGKAGTGKTYVSLAFALNLLKSNNNNFDKLFLIKSVTTLKGEEIGYLKGTLQEKIEPFMWSYFLNLEKIVSDEIITTLFVEKIVRPIPLAYARGITLDNAIIIGDEMQNISLENARTLVTRIGENSKIILIGDSNQIDLKNKKESSLVPLLSMFEDIDKIGCIWMNDNDENIRNPLIDIMEEKFKLYYENEK